MQVVSTSPVAEPKSASSTEHLHITCGMKGPYPHGPQRSMPDESREKTCTGSPALLPCCCRPERRWQLPVIRLYSSTEGDAYALDDLRDLARVVALRSGVLLYPGRLHPSPAGHCGGCSRDSAHPRPPDPATVTGPRASCSLRRALPGGVRTWEECARDRAAG